MKAACGATIRHPAHQYLKAPQLPPVNGTPSSWAACSGVPMLPDGDEAPHPGLVRMVEKVREAQSDSINHPSHYTWGPVEVIDLTEHLNFCLGNVVKYVCRADHKGSPIEDLKKAKWYLEREIQRREKEKA